MSSGRPMRVHVHQAPGPFTEQVLALLGTLPVDRMADARLAELSIAPLLTRRLTEAEWNAPIYGTLIFHPSLLPRHRGPDAVRWTVAAGDRFTGVTWFWCAAGLDTGDICEQELVAVPPGISAGRLYHAHLIPAGLRSLARAIEAMRAGYPRHVQQDETAATYEPRWPDTTPRNGGDPLKEPEGAQTG